MSCCQKCAEAAAALLPSPCGGGCVGNAPFVPPAGLALPVGHPFPISQGAARVTVRSVDRLPLRDTVGSRVSALVAGEPSYEDADPDSSGTLQDELNARGSGSSRYQSGGGDAKTGGSNGGSNGGRSVTPDDVSRWVDSATEFANDRFAERDAAANRAHLEEMARLDYQNNADEREYRLKLAEIERRYNLVTSNQGLTSSSDSSGPGTGTLLAGAGIVAAALFLALRK